MNTWLLEINSIEFKDDKKDGNSTYIEWSVYTKRRSFLFQVKLNSRFFLTENFFLLILVFTFTICEIL